MGTAKKKKTPLFGEKIRTSRDLIRIGSDSQESRDVRKLASKNGYVRWTYISVRPFAYGPLRTYVRLFACVRIRPSWVQNEFFAVHVQKVVLGWDSWNWYWSDLLIL